MARGGSQPLGGEGWVAETFGGLAFDEDWDEVADGSAVVLVVHPGEDFLDALGRGVGVAVVQPLSERLDSPLIWPALPRAPQGGSGSRRDCSAQSSGALLT